MEKTRRRKIYEVFDELAAAKSEAEAKRILEEYNELPTKIVLQMIYHPAVKFALPPTRPAADTYKLGDDHDHPNDLWRDLMSGSGAQIKIFLRNHGHDGMNQLRRETKFLDYIEGIAPKDAELLFDIIEDKVRSRLKFVTKEIIREVYGDILPV